MKRKNLFLVIAVMAVSCLGFAAQAAGVDVAGLMAQHADVTAGLSMMGAGTIDQLMKSMDGIEAKLKSMSEKADGELSTLGKVTADTKTALDTLGTQQRELADRMLALEQKGVLPPTGEKKDETWGAQVTKSANFAAFVSGQSSKLRVEVKNTLTGSDATVAPDRKPGIIGGIFQPLTMESLFPSLPTSSNAIEFTKENVFTNSAAEAAEGAAKSESALTWTLVNMPISTVAHWIKISRQLAADAPALAAYVNTRMRYGVDRRVETQLVSGDGVAPNISGILDAGNFVAHGYADAALGATLKKLVLIRKIIGDMEAAGLNPNAILLNPTDWAQIEIDIFTANTNLVAFRYDEGGRPVLFGRRVATPVGMTADQVAVGDFNQAGTIYNREGVVVDMSESDSDNFTKNLITIRAERRLALATEMPSAIRAGDLTPA